MQLATLIVAACGALFTALAAGAAFWTALTARDEARLRAEPHVATGSPTISGSGDEVAVTVKNLGLGPARLLRLIVYGNAEPAGVFTSPGLAPMETDDLVIPLMLWPKVEPPRPQDLRVAGVYQDAAGQEHPLYVQGRASVVDADTVERSEAFLARGEMARRHELKAVVRAAATENASLSTAAWMRYWTWVEATGSSPAGVEEEVKGWWEQLGGHSQRGFVKRSDLVLTEEDRRRWEAEHQPSPAGGLGQEG